MITVEIIEIERIVGSYKLASLAFTAAKTKTLEVIIDKDTVINFLFDTDMALFTDFSLFWH